MSASDYRRLGRRAFISGRVIECLPMGTWRQVAYREGYIKEMQEWILQCGHEGINQRGPYKLLAKDKE